MKMKDEKGKSAKVSIGVLSGRTSGTKIKWVSNTDKTDHKEYNLQTLGTNNSFLFCQAHRCGAFIHIASIHPVQ